MTTSRVPAQRRGARLRDHGGAPAPGRGAGGRPGHGRDPQAVLPLPLQAAVLPRRVPAGLQQPQRHADRLPGRDRADHRAGARWSTGQQYEVDCIIYGTGFEAELTPLVPSGRPRDRRPRRGHPGREVGRRRRQPVRDDEPRLPEHVRHAGAGPAGGGDRQLHPAGRARGRVRRRRRRAAREAGRRGVRRERRGRGGVDAEDRRLLRRRQRRHVRLHAVAHQQRGPPRSA